MHFLDKPTLHSLQSQGKGPPSFYQYYLPKWFSFFFLSLLLHHIVRSIVATVIVVDEKSNNGGITAALGPQFVINLYWSNSCVFSHEIPASVGQFAPDSSHVPAERESGWFDCLLLVRGRASEWLSEWWTDRSDKRQVFNNRTHAHTHKQTNEQTNKKRNNHHPTKTKLTQSMDWNVTRLSGWQEWSA